MEIFQDLVALLAGLLVIGWWLADWVRSGFFWVLDILDNDILNCEWKLQYACNLNMWLFMFCAGHKSFKCSCSGSCSTHSPTAWAGLSFPSPTPFPRTSDQFFQYNLHILSLVAWYAPRIQRLILSQHATDFPRIILILTSSLSSFCVD